MAVPARITVAEPQVGRTVPGYEKRRSTARTDALMFREPVSSSMIAAIGYDEERETLQVEFLSGAVYRYSGVEPDVYEDFRAASSKGTFFNERIKGAYPFEQYRADQA